MSEVDLTDDECSKLSKYATLFVGFSGGLDSTVLLHHLAHVEGLNNKVLAVHVHHGLSVHASSWQSHCLTFCDALNIPLITRQVDINVLANVEEQARIARFEVFRSLMTKDDGIALAHHQDDQAETLLLQLFRGAGIDGLAAMAPVTSLPMGELVRPFLKHTRAELLAYALRHQLAWIDDESNWNEEFSRNFLRHQVMPMLRQKWPSITRNLARTASHCQQAKENLLSLANLDYPFQNGASQPSLDLASLQKLCPSRLVNVLRAWIKKNEAQSPSSQLLTQIIEEVIFARQDATPSVQWAGVMVRRYQQTLILLRQFGPFQHTPVHWTTFPDPLNISLGAKGLCQLTATPADFGVRVPVGASVQVRFRQGGEVFVWHGQKKRLKKLWQQWQVPPWERDEIPLLYIDEALAAVIGFAMSSPYAGNHGENIYHIQILKRSDL
ncbi:MAG: tRNA lysidine(34) synthetase TilS [Legionellales bacterium]|nr:tRNA lysidine(34) synthetase TilS [Legionellales bacterium]